MIVEFLTWMEKENLINRSDIINSDDDGKNTRFRIQKGVFLAQHLGLETKYEYNLYSRGPISQQLAEDYLSVFRNNLKADVIDIQFNMEAVLDIMNHDDDWLEVASTLVDIATDADIASKADLINRTAVVKYLFPRDDIENVFNDLLSTQLAYVFEKCKE